VLIEEQRRELLNDIDLGAAQFDPQRSCSPPSERTPGQRPKGASGGRSTTTKSSWAQFMKRLMVPQPEQFTGMTQGILFKDGQKNRRSRDISRPPLQRNGTGDHINDAIVAWGPGNVTGKDCEIAIDDDLTRSARLRCSWREAASDTGLSFVRSEDVKADHLVGRLSPPVPNCIAR